MNREQQPPEKWGITAADFAKRAAERRVPRGTGSSALHTFTGDDGREIRTGRITWRPGMINFELIGVS